MLLEKDVVGKKTDWANYITLSDEHDTPLLKRLPKGPKPVNVVKHYQADTYEAPTPVAWPEGKSWDNFSTAGAQRKELVSRVQYLVQTAAVGKLAQDVTDTAGVTDELAREVTKKMTVIARQIECHAGCDQGAFADDGITGHMFRGIGKWIQTTPQGDADADVPASIRPLAGQISTAAIGALTEDVLKTMLESMWTATGPVQCSPDNAYGKFDHAWLEHQFLPVGLGHGGIDSDQVEPVPRIRGRLGHLQPVSDLHSASRNVGVGLESETHGVPPRIQRRQLHQRD